VVWDNTWEQFYANGGGNRYPEPAVIRFVMGRFSRSVNKREVSILDLGMGTGGNLFFLAREGFSAYGIDGSAAAIQEVKKMLSRERLTAEVSEGDFNKLPYNDDMFDAVIDCASIQHNSQSEFRTILDEIQRVLRPGGHLFSMILEEDNDLSAREFFTTRVNREKIARSFSGFNKVSVDHYYYTENDDTRSIKFFLVEADK
jgi:ubiquinone/menaquinone biosynthesis C-methylase UbiE